MGLECADQWQLSDRTHCEIVYNQHQTPLKLEELVAAQDKLLSCPAGNHKTAVTQTLIVIWQDECLKLLAFG